MVTGITSLGIDHVSTLGTTIKEIAWHKAGIYKVGLRLLATILVINPVQQEGVPALTVEQPEEAMAVLKQVAMEVKVGSTWGPKNDLHLILRKASSFSVVERIPEMDEVKLGERDFVAFPARQYLSRSLGLLGSHQYQNAALAVELSRVLLRSRTNLTLDEALPEPFKQGLIKTRWPGRCQVVHDSAHPQTTWFLDGAHTHESLECTIKWFAAPDTGLRGKYVSILSTEVARSNADGTAGGAAKEF